MVFAFILKSVVHLTEFSMIDHCNCFSGMSENHILIPLPPQIPSSHWNVSRGIFVGSNHVTSTRIVIINCLRVHSV
jgi:hypothetical protein